MATVHVLATLLATLHVQGSKQSSYLSFGRFGQIHGAQINNYRMAQNFDGGKY